jgi:hypothetical protein
MSLLSQKFENFKQRLHGQGLKKTAKSVLVSDLNAVSEVGGAVAHTALSAANGVGAAAGTVVTTAVTGNFLVKAAKWAYSRITAKKEIANARYAEMTVEGQAVRQSAQITGHCVKNATKHAGSAALSAVHAVGHGFDAVSGTVAAITIMMDAKAQQKKEALQTLEIIEGEEAGFILVDDFQERLEAEAGAPKAGL